MRKIYMVVYALNLHVIAICSYQAKQQATYHNLDTIEENQSGEAGDTVKGKGKRMHILQHIAQFKWPPSHVAAKTSQLSTVKYTMSHTIICSVLLHAYVAGLIKNYDAS